MTNQISNFSINSILKSFLILFVFCFAASNDSFAQFKFSQKNRVPAKYSKKYQINKNFKTPVRTCPDLKAMPIQFTIVSRTAHTARVRITAKVKNIGNQNYVSSSNQQSLQLYIGSTIVKNLPFQNLAKGTSRTTTFYMSYHFSEEFPTTIKSYVSYDPDIAVDGNTQNDECTYNNNSSSRSTTEIGGIL
ncbi:MAG: CARDB domain-containing protein [Chitinophagales bacterium]